MEFKDLPESVQVIAAGLLAEKMQFDDDRNQKEPGRNLAREVREAFIDLYFPAEFASTPNESD